MKTMLQVISSLLATRHRLGIKQPINTQKMEPHTGLSCKTLDFLFRVSIAILTWVTHRGASERWKQTAKVYDIVGAGRRSRFAILGSEGKLLISHNCDYGSQESLISGVVSGDANMVGAYESGDPYLAFAIDAGLAPAGATKKTHKAERDIGKLTILACNYGMGASTLNLLFLSATGKAPGMEYCKGLLALHKKVYKTFYEHKDKLWYNYREAGRPFVLPDGWYLDIDNPSRLSALNFITGQGHGGAIARVAEEKILHHFETRPGVALIGRVHDAFVYMRREDDTATDTLVAQLMKDACTEVLGVDLMRIGEPDICRHGELWTTEKNEKMLERMSKYFLESMTDAPQNFLTNLLDERI